VELMAEVSAISVVGSSVAVDFSVGYVFVSGLVFSVSVESALDG